MNKIKAAISFLSSLVQDGEFKDRVYLAGGAVRDMQLGLDPKDIDVVVTGDLNAGIDFANFVAKKTSCFKSTNPVVFPTYGTAKFQLFGVCYKGVNLSSVEVECVATRNEKYQEGSRNPEISSATLKEDVFRRDFTINSLLISLTSGKLLDLTGYGVSDIRKGVVRTTSDPNLIFSEDPLRMLRAIRFAFKYNWQIDDSIIEALTINAPKIQNISKERIQDELNKILLNDNPKKAFQIMHDSGLLYYFLPELCDCYKVEQGIHHCDDVFTHILKVVENSPPILEVRLMALFHDIAKPIVKSVGNNGKIHFYKHDKVGAEMAETIMRRLKYSNDIIDNVKLGVFHHMSFKKSGESGENYTDRSLRRFFLKAGENLNNILDLMHADNISHAPSSCIPNQIPEMKKRYAQLSIEDSTPKPKLPINGNDLIELGLKPGPIFKELLDKIEEEWCQDPNISKEKCIEIVKNHGRI